MGKKRSNKDSEAPQEKEFEQLVKRMLSTPPPKKKPKAEKKKDKPA